MFRVELNLETGERREIPKTAYRDPNDHSIIQVLDSTEASPPGMEVFDPSIDIHSSLYKQALLSLNTVFQKDVDTLMKAYSTVTLADGTNEPTKQETVRSQYATRKTQYLSDFNALKIQYGI